MPYVPRMMFGLTWSCVIVQLARDQASRLVDESKRLAELANDKLQQWTPLDALLLCKSAQEKIARADVSPQDFSSHFLAPLFLSRGSQENFWWPGRPTTLAERAAQGNIRVPSFTGIDRKLN
jgi:hypothetical protein